MNFMINLLMYDKDLSLCDLIMKSSVSDNYKIYFLDTYEDIFSYIRVNYIHVIILDIDKNKQEKTTLLKELNKSDTLLDVIITGKPLEPENVMDLINQGAADYMAKPVQLDTVEKVLKKILEKRILKKETFSLEKKLEKKYSFQEMIGKSPYMLETFSLIEKISKYFSSVLIVGETGTGKEMVAKAIHGLSQTRNKNLVICDSTSIPENLFESELFGYVRGAFTGADRNKRGLFEEAHEGIIFLDEIAEIPLTVQTKLLRVLEHHQFRPLGSNVNKKVKVKVIAATNRNLRECIKNRTFREDLFHRLNRVEIQLIPLREKTEDISLLVRHFLNRCNEKFAKEVKGISRDVQKLFLRYEWPGNIRELENVLERATMLCTKGFIDINDLPKYLQDIQPSGIKFPFVDRENLSTLDDLEKEYITFLLKTTQNNLRKTAKILNISRTTLYNKLRKYNITH